jgi:RHS repeat-associated protein
VYANDFTDLQIPTNGFPLTVGRHYESNRFIDGPLGIGWSSTLLPRLFDAVYLYSPSIFQHEIEILMPDGKLLPFLASNGSYITPLGRRDQLTLNGNGTWDLTLQYSRSVMHFNADGTLDTMTDDFGNALKYAYNGNGALLSVADLSGSTRRLDITWGASGRIATVTDNTGRTVEYSYAANGTLVGVTDPAARTSTLQYTAPRRFAPLLESVRDPWNRTITALGWDSNDRLASYTDGDYSDSTARGAKFTYDYAPDATPPRTIKTALRGPHATTYHYNGANWLISNDVSQYDAEGRVVTTADAFAPVAYTYDTGGRVLTVTRGGPLSNYVRSTLTYDATWPNKVASITVTSDTFLPNDWPGTLFTYYGATDPAPGALRFVKQRQGDGTTIEIVEQFQYDSKGRMTMHAAGDQQFNYAYNAAGDLLTTTRASDGAVSSSTFDSLGRTLTSTDVMAATTTYTYDAVDRIESVTAPKPSANTPFTAIVSLTYDHFDSTTGLTFTFQTDANGNVTKMGYDELGHLVRSVDALEHVTTYRYEDNLLKDITDANGNVTSFSYDVFGQLSRTTFPDGAFETYSTHSSGEPLSRTDRRSVTTGYIYDILGRSTGETFSTGGGITYSYTGQKLMTVLDTTVTPAQSLTYAYDTRYRLLTETQGNRGRLTYTYEDDANPRPQSYTVGPSSGSGYAPTANLSYDTSGRLAQIDWSAAGTFVFAYNKRDQYTTVTFAAGVVRSYTYDLIGRLTNLANEHVTAGNLATFAYEYDWNWSANNATMIGQRTSVAVSGAATLAGITKYHYDGNYQLIGADYPSGTSEQWQYDAIGNRTKRSFSSGLYTDYLYYKNGTNPNNGQRLKYHGTGSDLLYDANGNQTGTSTAQNLYTWDAMNRFVSSGTAYDGLGRRVAMSLSTPTVFVYAGVNVVGERIAAAGISNDYLFGPGMDEPLAVSGGSGQVAKYYLADGLGSIVGVVNSSGGIAAQYAYQPWGETSGSELFGYTGRERMPLSGGTLWHYRSRVYNADTGRFLSEDSLQEFIHVIGGALYTYAGNSAVAFTDPYGLKCVDHIYPGIKNVYKTTRTSTAWQSGGAEALGPDTGLPGPIAPQAPSASRAPQASGGVGWPVVTEKCRWHRWFLLTDFWRRKVRVVTQCDCGPYCSEDCTPATYVDWYEEWGSDVASRRSQQAWTQGYMIFGLMHPCQRPEQEGY